MKKIYKNIKMNFQKSKQNKADDRKKHEFLIVVKRSMKTCAFR